MNAVHATAGTFGDAIASASGAISGNMLASVGVIITLLAVSIGVTFLINRSRRVGK